MKYFSFLDYNSDVFFFMSTAIIDIGAAHFKYDMRRLTEILAFPRAWYRRSIVRRLFLGDFTGGAVSSEWDETSPAPATDSPGNHNVPPKRHSSRLVAVFEGIWGTRQTLSDSVPSRCHKGPMICRFFKLSHVLYNNILSI